MLLRRTEKARCELRPGVRTLGLRERSLLLLADGNKSLFDFGSLFDGAGQQIVLNLVRDGYLEAAQNPASFKHAVAPLPWASTAVPPSATPAPSTADSFEGKRSLATTRMFLFDLCERMFVRRDPERAEEIRQALRNARERDSMLAVARDMIAEIERVAGHERADSISERIAMLLPPEPLPGD